MSSRYLIRLDDACPTMCAHRWGRLEAIFAKREIKPLVAVVPDNVDPFLIVDLPDPQFWSKVRAWQDKGWSIAMHGYQHLFHDIDRRKLLLPFYDRSEFAGKSISEQRIKIRSSWSIFQREGVTPNVWIAPAHCFDLDTLCAIKSETSIRIVSDGIAIDQYFEHDFFWLPQQLWSFEKKKIGLWTICLHPNSMSDKEIDDLDRLLATDFFSSRVVCVGDLDLAVRSKNWFDRLYSLYFWNIANFYKIANDLRRTFFNRNQK